jgi:hypothetical protein
MEFPDADAIREAVGTVSFPRFAAVRYEPPAPTVDDPAAVARDELERLPLDSVPSGGTVAVGLGSRGVTDVVPVAVAVVTGLRDRGLDPVAVPAMGSHGGASAEGQRRTLASLGLTEDALGCPVDARMDTVTVGDVRGTPVHLAAAAAEADAFLVVNRVKPHTNFTGAVESGLCKMTAIGLGKRAGAAAIHERAFEDGYVPAIVDAVETIRSSSPAAFLGGVALVENFYEETARVAGVSAADLPGAEADLLELAREQMATLPFDDLDVLVVDELGKDVSGTGMDTNVVGRYGVLGSDDPEAPSVDRVVVRGLTDATHGNGHGIGLADLTTTDAVASLDLGQMYENALTSGSLARDSIPVALPTDELAVTAACTTAGPYDPETARIAWIRDTSHLSTVRVSEALAADVAERDHLTVDRWEELTFEGGTPRFVPGEP